MAQTSKTQFEDLKLKIRTLQTGTERSGVSAAAVCAEATEATEAEATEAEATEAEATEAEAAYRAALESAVRSLGQREHGRRELERKLKNKGHAQEVVARVLSFCAENDLQSDTRYVESYIRARILKGYGPVKIRQELSGRGISESVLESQLTEPADYWVEQAGRALDKKFRSARARGQFLAEAQETPEVADPADPDLEAGVHLTVADWNRQARFLARRGFPSDLIYRVLGPQSH